MKKLLLFCAAVTLSCTLQAQTPDAVVKKIIEIGRTDNQSMQHLDILSNRFGGRLIGSDAYDNSADWVASKFKEWGLDVEMQEAGVMNVGFNRGPWFGKLLGENGMNLHFATPSYSSGTKGPQKGHVLLEPKTREEFERMKGALKGAWVLISGTNSGWTIDWSPKADESRARMIAENIEITRKNREITDSNRQNNETQPLTPLKDVPALFLKEMREAGILGIIQSSATPIRALYDRTVVKDPDMTFDKLPTIPDIKLDEHQYKIIAQMAKERRSFMLEFDIRNHFKMGPVKYYNVIGTIKGSSLPNEYVLSSGHLDCFDVATGGVDDGSGVTPTMEAARMIMKSGAKPKRTMKFCIFAGEEFGLLGATAWVKGNTDKLPKILNLFNRDSGPTVPVGISVPKAFYNDYVAICAPIKSINPDFPFEVTSYDPRPKPTSAGGTDATVFAMEGVPTMGFNLADTKGYNFDYQEIWHTERDLYNKSIPEYQEHAATVTAIVALGVANLNKTPNLKEAYSEAQK